MPKVVSYGQFVQNRICTSAEKILGEAGSGSGLKFLTLVMIGFPVCPKMLAANQLLIIALSVKGQTAEGQIRVRACVSTSQSTTRLTLKVTVLLRQLITRTPQYSGPVMIGLAGGGLPPSAVEPIDNKKTVATTIRIKYSFSLFIFFPPCYNSDKIYCDQIFIPYMNNPVFAKQCRNKQQYF